MRVVFRADGGGAIGWGHLGRCAALAEVLKDCGVQADWACRATPAVERLTGGPPALTLEGSPSYATLPQQEAVRVSAFAANADWVVIDHYGADTAYLAALRTHTHAQLLIIDDHQIREDADLRLAPTQPDAPHTLSGAAFQLVRPCFSQVTARARGGWVLALGGADPQDDTVTCAEHLDAQRPLTVLASDAIAERQDLDATLRSRSGEAQRHGWMAPADLATTFATCNAALVSASTLSWEALATRTPIVALQTADNQVGVVATLRAAGIPVFTSAMDAVAAMNAGHASLPMPDATLDGLGAWRVAHAMGASTGDLP